MSRPPATGGAPLPQDVGNGACQPRPRSVGSPRGVRVRWAQMAPKPATRARPLRGGDQGLPGRPEPGVQPPLPPGTHNHHRQPKRRPHRRRRHRPTHSHRHSRSGRHAPTGPHLPHGRARRHTLPLLHQAGTHPSRIDTCYGDPTTVRGHEATYGDTQPAGTGQGPLYIDLIIPNLPQFATTLPDNTLPPTLRLPAENDHSAWHRYNRALHAILRRPDAPSLTTAMRWAAQACGMERDTSHTGAPADLTLQQLVHDI